MNTCGNITKVTRLVAAFVASLVLTSCLFMPAVSLADESNETKTTSAVSEDNNQVYPNQMPDSSFLYETSIAELASADSFYDGQTVMVEGEVVGDRVNDELNSAMCWITLQELDAENPSVVAVTMSKDQSQIIDTYGKYNTTGTTLQVRGTFHLDCDDHQGESDIHVTEVSAVAQGASTPSEVNPVIVIAAVVTILVGAALTGLYYFLRERAR